MPKPKEFGGDRVHSQIEDEEVRIADSTVEVSSAWDKNGKPIFDNLSTYSENTVNIPQQYYSRLFDGYITHNHPTGKMFSPDDVGFAVMQGLKEIRAVSPDGESFVLEKVWKELSPTQLRFIRHYRDFAELQRDLVASRFEQKEANKVWTKTVASWMKENASKYGYKFRVEKLSESKLSKVRQRRKEEEEELRELLGGNS